MRLPRNLEKLRCYPYFTIDNQGMIPEATLFMLHSQHIKEICSFLCSEIGFFIFTRFYMGPVFDDTGFRYKKEYLVTLPIPKNLDGSEFDYEERLANRLGLNEDEMNLILSYKRSLLEAQVKSSVEV